VFSAEVGHLHARFMLLKCKLPLIRCASF
jgi:hypothetical protein